MKTLCITAAVFAVTLAAAPVYAADTKPASSKEHDHNHADAPGTTPASKTPAMEKTGQSDPMMKRMHDMHKKMMDAKTPEERQALMDQHMKLMQEGMQTMKGMGQKSGQQSMEKRMEMMEMMMQMMMGREMMESGR